MSVKRKMRTRCATLGPQDPRGRVRAKLPEVQSRRLYHGPADIAPGETRAPAFVLHPPPDRALALCVGEGTSAIGATGNEPDKRRTDHLPHARHVTRPVSAGSPNGREPYGDRVPIVVRGRESRPHGEGEQVATMPPQGGARDAQCRNCVRHHLDATGEPDDAKVSRPVRWGAFGKGAMERWLTMETSPGAYPIKPRPV